jgi:hypothetical protein
LRFFENKKKLEILFVSKASAPPPSSFLRSNKAVIVNKTKMERIQTIVGHFQQHQQKHLQEHSQQDKVINKSDCIGEMENRQLDEHAATSSGALQPGAHYARIPVKVAFEDKTAADERYGGTGEMAILEGELLQPKTNSKTVFVFMHP